MGRSFHRFSFFRGGGSHSSTEVIDVSRGYKRLPVLNRVAYESVHVSRCVAETTHHMTLEEPVL